MTETRQQVINICAKLFADMSIAGETTPEEEAFIDRWFVLVCVEQADDELTDEESWSDEPTFEKKMELDWLCRVGR